MESPRDRRRRCCRTSQSRPWLGAPCATASTRSQPKLRAEPGSHAQPSPCWLRRPCRRKQPPPRKTCEGRERAAPSRLGARWSYATPAQRADRDPGRGPCSTACCWRLHRRRPRPQPWLPAHASRTGSNARERARCDGHGVLRARQRTRRSSRTAAAWWRQPGWCRPWRQTAARAHQPRGQHGWEPMAASGRFASGRTAAACARAVAGPCARHEPADGGLAIESGRRCRKFHRRSTKEQHHLTVTRDT